MAYARECFNVLKSPLKFAHVYLVCMAYHKRNLISLFAITCIFQFPPSVREVCELFYLANKYISEYFFVSYASHNFIQNK